MQKARIKLSSTDHNELDGVCSQIKAIAEKTGVTGWVRNLPDGTVEAVFEGEKEAIETTIRMCTENQPHARVDKYSVKWEEYTGSFASFEIRR